MKTIKIFNFRIIIVNESTKYIMEQWDKIYKYAENGERIKAIKTYRKLMLGMGCGLKEAYDYINELQAKIKS